MTEMNRVGVQKIKFRVGRRGRGNKAQGFKGKKTAKCPQHHHFAMRKINHKHNAIYEGVANGNERIHAPQDQTGKTKTNPCVGAKVLLQNDYVVNPPQKK